MSLRTKSLLTTITLVALLIAGMFGAMRWLVIRGFREAEERATKQHTAEVRSLVETVITEFGQRFEDWSSWDAVAAYAEQPNEEFLHENVTYDNVTETLNLQFMAIVRGDGRIVLGVWADADAKRLVQLPADLTRELAPGGILAAEDNAPAIDGIVMVDGRPYEVSSRPVLRTDKSVGKVPARFVVGRAMDDKFISRLERFSFTHLELVTRDEPPRDNEALEYKGREALARGEDVAVVPTDVVIHGLTRLSDLRGEPALYLEVERERRASHDAQSTLNLTMVAGSLSGLLTVLALIGILNRLVLRPLNDLLHGVRRVELGHFEPVAVTTSDEIGRLGHGFNQAVAAISRREAELRSANARIKLVLDGAGDGFVGITREGVIDGIPSAAMTSWFGIPVLGQTIGAYLFDPEDEDHRSQLELGLLQIADDFLPFEVCVDQLPKRFMRDGRHFALELRQTDSAMLAVIVRDITLSVEKELTDARQRELHHVVRHVLRDPREFKRFAEEVESLFASALGAKVPGDLARFLHTLKGTLAVLGFAECSRHCHHAEDLLAEDGVGAAQSALLAARERWSATLRELSPFLGRRDAVEISVEEHRALVDRLVRLGVDARTVENVEALAYRPAEGPLARLAEHAERIADRLNKPITVRVDHGGVRVPTGPVDAFCEALVHVVRNAIDHGLESPEDRVRAGKSPVGAVELCARVEGMGDKRTLAFEVRDDGAGIDWEAVRAKGVALGLPFQDTPSGLVELIFSDGFSTRDEVSETSGRGVGLAALREACTAAGGVYGLHTVRGRGTSFVFRFPLPALGDVWAPTVPPPARHSNGLSDLGRLVH